MSEFKSQFARHMEDMLELRTALGYSRSTYLPRLCRLDSFIAANFGERECFSEDIVLGFIRSGAKKVEPARGANDRAGIARIFGEYLRSVGRDAYVIPKNFTVRKTKSEPYMMTDSELSAFFNEVDRITDSERRQHEKKHRGCDAQTHLYLRTQARRGIKTQDKECKH